MAHSRKDNYVVPPEWWVHLRPYNKRKVSKRERRAAIKRIKKEKEEEN